MDTRIIEALRTAGKPLTVRELTAAVKVYYPTEEGLKTRVNSLLYGVLSKTGRVKKSDAAENSKAPLWILVSQTVTFVDLATTAIPTTVDGTACYFGPVGTVNAPAGATLAANYQLQLAMAVQTEKCLGNTVKILTDNPDLRSLA